MRLVWTTAACAAFGLLSAGAAFADPAAATASVGPSGLVDVDYAYVDVSGGHANTLGGQLSGVLPVGSSISLQGQGGYHHLSASSGAGSSTTNDWEVGGSGFWQGSMGRLGGGVDYNAFNFSAKNKGDVSFLSYGAFGEWYATDRVTVGLKGGGISGVGSSCKSGGLCSSGSGTLGYVGGELTGYATPDLGISGFVDWAGQGGASVTAFTARAEYLFSHTTPVALYASYTYTDLSGNGKANASIFSIGVRLYLGGMGSLVERRRSANGVDAWGAEDTDIRFLQ